MITWTFISVALLLGYGLTVTCLLVVTFGLTSASPGFVAKEYRITAGYKRLQALVWLVCVTAGAFVTCAVAQGAHPWLVPALLATILIGMLWRNSWEKRQRGMAHQILMSLVSIVGVVGGFALGNYVFKL